MRLAPFAPVIATCICKQCSLSIEIRTRYRALNGIESLESEVTLRKHSNINQSIMRLECRRRE
jgi:hypothetical protein